MAEDDTSEPHRPGPGCVEMFEQLSEYLDGELPEDVAERMRRHVEDCDPCVRFVESLRRAVRMIELEGPEPIPDDLRRNLIRAAEAVEDR
jgi:anti-sigma factor (TIGR02949 family)